MAIKSKIKLFVYFRLGYILLLFFFCTFFLHSHTVHNTLEYGKKIEPITGQNIFEKPVTLPIEGKVTVLFFFNINRSSHLYTVSELNNFYGNNPDLNTVELIFISNGEPSKFQDTYKRYKLKFNLVNDIDGRLFNYFDFACGVCNKVIIMDRDETLRYNASHVDIDFIETIVRRYAETKTNTKN